MENKIENRRQFRRIAVNIPVKAYVKTGSQQGFDGDILDISEGGAFLHCTAPITIGDELELEIRLIEPKILTAKVIDYAEWLKKQSLSGHALKSVVRWANVSSSSGFGIEFQISPSREKRSSQSSSIIMRIWEGQELSLPSSRSEVHVHCHSETVKLTNVGQEITRHCTQLNTTGHFYLSH